MWTWQLPGIAMTSYCIVHTTRYEFDEVTASCHLEARLPVQNLPSQTYGFHQLVVRPLTGKRREWRDAFGNPACGFTVPAALQTMEVTTINVMDCTPGRPWTSPHRRSGMPYRLAETRPMRRL